MATSKLAGKFTYPKPMIQMFPGEGWAMTSFHPVDRHEFGLLMESDTSVYEIPAFVKETGQKALDTYMQKHPDGEAS